MAPEHKQPEKGKGYGYIYERLYRPFVCGQAISLSSLELDAFSSEDVLELSGDFYTSYKRQLDWSEEIKKNLWKATPLPFAASFL